MVLMIPKMITTRGGVDLQVPLERGRRVVSLELVSGTSVLILKF